MATGAGVRDDSSITTPSPASTPGSLVPLFMATTPTVTPTTSAAATEAMVTLHWLQKLTDAEPSAAVPAATPASVNTTFMTLETIASPPVPSEVGEGVRVRSVFTPLMSASRAASWASPATAASTA